ncbi:MAG: hypothetical protein LBT55_06250 [Clostridiaceae bacterium]|jgi:hypothetical protein|nr:hypothetical protein [Clostridiaceae bacterium]
MSGSNKKYQFKFFFNKKDREDWCYLVDDENNWLIDSEGKYCHDPKKYKNPQEAEVDMIINIAREKIVAHMITVPKKCQAENSKCDECRKTPWKEIASYKYRFTESCPWEIQAMPVENVEEGQVSPKIPRDFNEYKDFEKLWTDYKEASALIKNFTNEAAYVEKFAKECGLKDKHYTTDVLCVFDTKHLYEKLGMLEYNAEPVSDRPKKNEE